MTAAAGPDPDEDALRWAGDEDRGQYGPSTATPDEVAGADPVTDAGVAAAGAASAGRMVGTWAFGALFLAYTVGWIFSVQITFSASATIAAEVLWQFGEFLAMVSAALWFGATVSLTRESRARVRFGWLAAGALVLVPWPILLVVLS